MKFMLFVLPTVPGTLEDRKRLRPIGRNNERYQQMLDEMRKLAVFADDAGFDVMATTEHHFHSEGYETSVAPLLLYADLAARTKRIKFSPLGLVLPSWDPIRAAEELAVLDHLTKGRIYAGFARGYQDRWVNVLGQQYHVTGAPMDGSSIDNHNRKVYEETLKVIKKAWTEESLDYDGEYYKVPYPYKEGITRWPVARMDADLRRARRGRRQGRHPQDLRRAEALPAAASAAVPALLGERDRRSATPRSRTSCRGSWCPTRPTSSACAGSTRRWRPEPAASSAWARASAPSAPSISAAPRPRPSSCCATTNYAGFNNYFGGFGFWEAFRTPEDAEKYPMDPYTPLPPAEWTLERMRKVKYALAGTRRPGEARDRGAAQDRRRRRARMVRLVLRPGLHVARRGDAADGDSSPSTSFRRSTDRGGHEIPHGRRWRCRTGTQEGRGHASRGQTIYELRKAGFSVEAIARELNERKVPAPLGAKWHRTSVGRRLHRLERLEPSSRTAVAGAGAEFEEQRSASIAAGLLLPVESIETWPWPDRPIKAVDRNATSAGCGRQATRKPAHRC